MFSDIQKHLKRYKLRAKVTIEDVTNELDVWAFLPALLDSIGSKTYPKDSGKFQADPRGREFGYRAIFPKNKECECR